MIRVANFAHVKDIYQSYHVYISEYYQSNQ